MCVDYPLNALASIFAITGHFHRQLKRDIMQTRCKARANVHDETVANAARLVTD
jgi:hypothetical protein